MNSFELRKLGILLIQVDDSQYLKDFAHSYNRQQLTPTPKSTFGFASAIAASNAPAATLSLPVNDQLAPDAQVYYAQDMIQVGYNGDDDAVVGSGSDLLPLVRTPTPITDSYPLEVVLLSENVTPVAPSTKSLSSSSPLSSSSNASSPTHVMSSFSVHWKVCFNELVFEDSPQIIVDSNLDPALEFKSSASGSGEDGVATIDDNSPFVLVDLPPALSSTLPIYTKSLRRALRLARDGCTIQIRRGSVIEQQSNLAFEVLNAVKIVGETVTEYLERVSSSSSPSSSYATMHAASGGASVVGRRSCMRDMDTDVFANDDDVDGVGEGGTEEEDGDGSIADVDGGRSNTGMDEGEGEDNNDGDQRYYALRDLILNTAVKQPSLFPQLAKDSNVKTYRMMYPSFCKDIASDLQDYGCLSDEVNTIIPVNNNTNAGNNSSSVSPSVSGGSITNKIPPRPLILVQMNSAFISLAPSVIENLDIESGHNCMVCSPYELEPFSAITSENVRTASDVR